MNISQAICKKTPPDLEPKCTSLDTLHPFTRLLKLALARGRLFCKYNLELTNLLTCPPYLLRATLVFRS